MAFSEVGAASRAKSLSRLGTAAYFFPLMAGLFIAIGGLRSSGDPKHILNDSRLIL